MEEKKRREEAKGTKNKTIFLKSEVSFTSAEF